jgi:hypothetical protein
MGAWGVLAYDNDDANDWAYELEAVNDLSLIESALAAVEAADGYLDASEACNALAACEVLARLRGNSGYQNAYTEKVDLWVQQHPLQPSAELLARASSVMDRILADDSELREIWEESDATEWLASMADLRARMTA